MPRIICVQMVNSIQNRFDIYCRLPQNRPTLIKKEAYLPQHRYSYTGTLLRQVERIIRGYYACKLSISGRRSRLKYGLPIMIIPGWNCLGNILIFIPPCMFTIKTNSIPRIGIVHSRAFFSLWIWR